MSFWNTRQIKRTKKPHQCQFCGRIIPAGSSCESNSGTFDGEFNYYHLCNRCVKFIQVHNCDLSDGFNLGDFYDCICDLRVDCPECASQYYQYDHVWDVSKMSCTYECDECDNKWVVDYSMGETDTPK
jgi:hypothetical protein